MAGKNGLSIAGTTMPMVPVLRWRSARPITFTR